MEYMAIGPQFSSLTSQTLLVLLKQLHPEVFVCPYLARHHGLIDYSLNFESYIASFSLMLLNLIGQLAKSLLCEGLLFFRTTHIVIC